jgi:hypothetical protein
MRIALVILFIANSSMLFGQSKWVFVGTYEHSLFMYSYTLTLKDSENYEIVESSDLGSEKTIGTWTMMEKTIRLAPKKKITSNAHEKEIESVVTGSREEIIVIETKDLLIPMSRDFSLARKK